MDFSENQPYNMALPIIVTVKADQQPVEGEPETVEFVTDGQILPIKYPNGDGAILKYDESELTGMEGVHTTVRCYPDHIVVDRDGSMESHMIFEKGKRHVSLYETPCGCLTVATIAFEVSAETGTESGRIWLRYDLEVENNISGHNSIEITYTKKR